MPKLMIDREMHKRLCDELLEKHPDLAEVLEIQAEFEHLYFAELAAIGPIRPVKNPMFYYRDLDEGDEL